MGSPLRSETGRSAQGFDRRAAGMAPGDIGLGLLAAVLWGMTFVITAAALERVPPILFTALRFAAAAALIAIVPRPAASWRVVVAAGLLLGAAQFGCLFTAMAAGVPPGMAAVLVHTQAIMMVALGALLLGERPRAGDILACGLALAGVVVLALAKQGTGPLSGMALVLLAALSGAAGNLVLKRAGSANSLSFAVWMSVVPPLPLFALSLWLEGPERVVAALVASDWVVIGAVAYSALLSTVLAYAIWGRLFGRYPSTRTAPFLLLVPIVGLASSMALLGEPLTVAKALGAGLVLAGLGLAALARSRWAGAARVDRQDPAGKPETN